MRGHRKTNNLDPLFELFESYLMNRSYEDAGAFTRQLAQDYVAYLDSSPAHIPLHLRESVMEDLELEAHELLVRKMYGCVRQKDYENCGKVLSKAPKFTQFNLPRSSVEGDSAEE